MSVVQLIKLDYFDSGVFNLVLLVSLAVGSFAMNELGNVYRCKYEEKKGLVYKMVDVLNPVEYPNYKNLSLAAILKENKKEISKNEGHKMTTEENQIYTEKNDRNKKRRIIVDHVVHSIYSLIIMARPDLNNIVGEYNEPNNLEMSADMDPCFQDLFRRLNKSCFSMLKNPFTYSQLSIIRNLCVADKHIHKTMGIVVNRVCGAVPFNVLDVDI